MIRQWLVKFGLLMACYAGSPASAQESSLVAPGEKVTKLAGDLKFTEGPAWFPAKKLLVFSDIPNSKLMQWSEAGGLSVFRESEASNGNILDLEGRLITCQHAVQQSERRRGSQRRHALVHRPVLGTDGQR